MIRNFAPQHFTPQPYPMWAVVYDRDADRQPSEVCLTQIIGWVPWCTDDDGHIEQLSPVVVAMPGGAYLAEDFVPSCTADSEPAGRGRGIEIYTDLAAARERAESLATTP